MKFSLSGYGYRVRRFAAPRNDDHSTFSTNTRIVPPQESPTFQAVSSATPNSSVLGLPLSITSRASVTTAPSTQPPDTEPRKLPWSSITRLEPTGRGAEPQVSTTVATATPRPAFFQSSAALRMSSSLASMRCLRCSKTPDSQALAVIYDYISRDHITRSWPARFSDRHDCHVPKAPGRGPPSTPNCLSAAIRQRAAASL